jgi:hypothetical protein
VVECQLPKLDVAGSSPVARSLEIPPPLMVPRQRGFCALGPRRSVTFPVTNEPIKPSRCSRSPSRSRCCSIRYSTAHGLAAPPMWASLTHAPSRTTHYLSPLHPSLKAHPGKPGAAKSRVLVSSATPPQVAPDATKDPKIAELPKGKSAFVFVRSSQCRSRAHRPVHGRFAVPAGAVRVAVSARFSRREDRRKKAKMRIHQLAAALMLTVIAAGCADAPTELAPGERLPGGTTGSAARLDGSCRYSDEQATKTRTVTADCGNAQVSLPKGWSLRVQRARTRPGEVRVGPGTAESSPSPAATIDIPRPDADYLSATTKIDIASLPEFSIHTSVTDGVQTVSFSTPMERRQVPDSWATWSSPPESESATPPVLFTLFQNSLTLELARPASIFGFELEPNAFAEFSFTADFFSGAELVGSITRTVAGDAGAQLFAAQSDGPPIDRIAVSTVEDPGGFAIAQIRYSVVTPVEIDIEPAHTANRINLRSGGKLKVAILTTETFDAASVRPATVTLGNGEGRETPVESKPHGRFFAKLKDVDGDRDLDLLLRFSIPALVASGDLTPTTKELILQGETRDGLLIRGTDEVTVQSPGPLAGGVLHVRSEW